MAKQLLRKVNLKLVDDIFNSKFLPFLNAPQPLQIFFGGSSSGKSVFLAQRTVKDVTEGRRNYLIIRNVSNTIRASCFNEVKKIIQAWGLSDIFTIRETDMEVTCANGRQIIFRGLDDVEKLKSITPRTGVITDIWIEEATETAENDIKQLLKRLRGGSEDIPKRITLSFNPILQSHWIYKTHFGQYIEGQPLITPDLLILHSTYKDNCFLTAQDKAALENEKDEYFYKVYTLGQWGVLGDVIFKNWSVADIKNNSILFKTFDRFRHGLDFGYSNDPTAYNRMYYYKAGKTLYITDEIHLHGATNDIIARELKPIVGSDILICDSAEPKSIQELRNLTLNAVGAQKGKDSVAWGIQWLQQQNIIIDISCQYTKNEFEQYHWQKNKDGENMRVPVDRDNHHIDNIRYAVEDITLQTGLGLYNFAEEQYKRFQEENKQVFVQSSIAQQEVEYLTLNQ